MAFKGSGYHLQVLLNCCQLEYIKRYSRIFNLIDFIYCPRQRVKIHIYDLTKDWLAMGASSYDFWDNIHLYV